MCLLLMLDKVISVIQQQVRGTVVQQENLNVSLTYFRVNISLQSRHGITFWGLWPGIDSQISSPISFWPSGMRHWDETVKQS